MNQATQRVLKNGYFILAEEIEKLENILMVLEVLYEQKHFSVKRFSLIIIIDISRI